MNNIKYSSCIDEHIMISHDWELTMHLKWPEHVYKSLCYPNVRGARDVGGVGCAACNAQDSRVELYY